MRIGCPVFLCCLAILTGCVSTPSVEFMGAERTEIVLQGRSFTVFRKDDEVQVVREGLAYRAEQRRMRPLMIEAAARATGCTPREATFEGDTALIRGVIDC